MPTTNMQWLIIHKASRDAIPDGGGVADGIRFLSDPDKLRSGLREAQKWVEAAIQAVRLAAEPNPWKDSADEEIAGEIRRQIESRKPLSSSRKLGRRY